MKTKMTNQPKFFSTMLNLTFIILLLVAIPGIDVNAQNEISTYTAAGTYGYYLPASVTKLKVEVWGAGGNGGSVSLSTHIDRGAGGGGGGGYSKSILTGIPSGWRTVTVGAGGKYTGEYASDGGPSWFHSAATVLAYGGKGVALGSFTGGAGAVAGIGNVVTYSGGSGMWGSDQGDYRAGGGGSSSGSGSNGVNAGSPLPYNKGIAPWEGGDGGDGAMTAGNYGSNASAPGGGGGGGWRSSSGFAKGGDGGDGKVKITHSNFNLQSTQAISPLYNPGETSTVTLRSNSVGLPYGEVNVFYTLSDHTPGNYSTSATITYSGSIKEIIFETVPISKSTTITITKIETDEVGNAFSANHTAQITLLLPPQGSLQGNSICEGETGQLTFTATEGSNPFTLIINGVTYTDIQSGIAFNAVPNPTVTTNYTLTSITDGNNLIRTTDITDPDATITRNYDLIYRTKSDGNWTDKNIWEFFNGVDWIAAGEYPGELPGYCYNFATVFNEVTAGSTVTFDNVLVESGGKLTVTPTLTFHDLDILSGGVLILQGETIIEGSGNFHLRSGAQIHVGSANGVSINDVSGNIRHAVRDYESGAHFKYSGVTSQITGDGPSQNQPASLMIDNPGNTVTSSVPLNITGNLNISNGTYVSGNHNLSVGGDWTNNGDYASGAATVTLNGSTQQIIEGTSETSFYNLILDNPGGFLLEQNITVDHQLALENGVVTTGNQVLTLLSSGAITASSPTAHINGKLARGFDATGIKIFPIGKDGYYRPLSFEYTALDAASIVLAEQFETGLTGTLPPNTSLLTTNRHWEVTQSGAVDYKYFITLDATGYDPGSYGVVVLKKHEANITAHASGQPEYTNVDAFDSMSSFGLGTVSPTVVEVDDKSIDFGTTSLDLTATVIPTPNGGVVDFYVDDVFKGSVGVVTSTGLATLNINPDNFSTGNHVIRAEFSGHGIIPSGSSHPLHNGTLEVLPPLLHAYVSPQGGGAKNGRNWENAFDGTQLQSAILLPYVTEIWVAAGTYTPTSSHEILNPTSRHKHFRVKEGLAIYGGFYGDEPEDYNLSQRNFQNNETILSGDLGEAGKCYHVVISGDPSAAVLQNSVIIDGFIISDGCADLDTGGKEDEDLFGVAGAGMLLMGGDYQIANCSIMNNVAFMGGGLATVSSTLTLDDCSFKFNNAMGGAAIFSTLSNVQVSKVDLSGNIAAAGGSVLSIFNYSSQIADCGFIENTALIGGAILNVLNAEFAEDFLNLILNGNGKSNFSPPPTLPGEYNMVPSIFKVLKKFWHDTQMIHKNKVDEFNITIANTIFSNNHAEWPEQVEPDLLMLLAAGGAIVNIEAGMEIETCSFLQNNASSFGGAIVNVSVLGIEEFLPDDKNNVSGFEKIFQNNTEESNGFNPVKWVGYLFNQPVKVQKEDDFPTLLIKNSDFTQNHTTYDFTNEFIQELPEGIELPEDFPAGISGGAIFNIIAEMKMEECKFDSNSSLLGGAVTNLIASHLNEDSDFLNNKSVVGGSIFSILTSPVFNRCFFQDNTAWLAGGGLAMIASGLLNEQVPASLAECRFENNQTLGISIDLASILPEGKNDEMPINLDLGGGAIFTLLSNLMITQSEYFGNKGMIGGAIGSLLSLAEIDHSEYEGNTALMGGAVANLLDIAFLENFLEGNIELPFGKNQYSGLNYLLGELQGALTTINQNALIIRLTNRPEFKDEELPAFKIKNSIVQNNHAIWPSDWDQETLPEQLNILRLGGGILNLVSSLKTENCLLSNNSAFAGGACANIMGHFESINSTLTGNSSIAGGGIASVESTTILENSIIWENQVEPFPFGEKDNDFYGHQIATVSGTLTIDFSCFPDGADDILSDGNTTFNFGDNNIHHYPHFANSWEKDFRIAGSSPCVDKGLSEANNEEFDIRGEGFPRIMPKTGTKDDPVIDLGAYEYNYNTDPLYPCNNPAVSGEIVATVTNVCYGEIPGIIASVTDAGTYSGTLEYQWQASTVSPTFFNISGANGKDFTPETGIVSETWFRRLARVECMSDWSGAAVSNVVKIAVEPLPVAGTFTKFPDEILVVSGTTVSATFTEGSGGNGTDILRFRTQTGGSWSDWETYISGMEITLDVIQAVEIQTWREASYCNDSQIVSVTWTIESPPVGGSLIKTPIEEFVCNDDEVSAQLIPGSGGNGSDELQIRVKTDGVWTDWTVYFPETLLPVNGFTDIEIRTRRLAGYYEPSAWFTVNWKVDLYSPVAIPVNSQIELNPDGTYPLTPDDVLAEYDDNETGIASVNITPATLTCIHSGTIVEVKVVVSDLCGNQATVYSQVTVPEGSTILPPWFKCDTDPAAAGTSIFEPCNSDGTFMLTATGKSTTLKDVYHFVYRDICEPKSTVIARLDDVKNGGWAGVMMRENCGPASRCVLFKTRLYNPNVIIGYRTIENKAMRNLSQVAQLIRWMKIQRNGSNFKVLTSYNGTTWQQRYSGTINMNSCIQAGIFTESVLATRTSVAWFDHVEVVDFLKSGDEFADIETIKSVEGQFRVDIYPNPAEDLVTISIPENEEKVNYSITNLDGRVIEQSSFTGSDAVLDVSGFRPGLYVIRMEIGRAVVTKRIVVM
ncbi:MAG: T9SS type A sorting domain-containing protein [Bacteroidales bacterium]|nr:T9SS type A sorting domain-containing protein [Bacteroidales bacterium]